MSSSATRTGSWLTMPPSSGPTSPNTSQSSKFSDSASDEWLNDFADATSIAATVLMRYKPMEPEMVLQLCGQRFRQWHVTSMSGGKRYFQTPWLDKALGNKPTEITSYEAAAWARGRVSLLDFLRKTNNQGKILAWLKKAHAKAATAASLEDFAAAYKMRGEKLVAADTVSRLNDHFYGQWLILHVPFRRLEDLMDAAVLDKVPAEHRNFACCVFNKHPVGRAVWESEETMRQELKMEGHTDEHADTILRMPVAGLPERQPRRQGRRASPQGHGAGRLSERQGLGPDRASLERGAGALQEQGHRLRRRGLAGARG